MPGCGLRSREPRPRLVGDWSEKRTGKEPLVNTTTVRYGYTDRFIFSSEKAKRELGYAPGPIEPAIAAALGWFRERGMV